jgi:hypothetical protein
LRQIRRIIAKDLAQTRWAISQRVCEALGWRKPNGGLKEMSCRVALLRMQADGSVCLPAPRRRNGNGKGYRRRTVQGEPAQPVRTPACDLRDLQLVAVSGGPDSRLWNEYIERYHYLGYRRLPGAQLRYFAQAGGSTLAVLGFGAAAWKTAPRDRFIGWSHEQRERGLRFVVNTPSGVSKGHNARFLILPWVTSRHLASKLLGMAARRLPGDWLVRYGYRPVLLETFVEKQRFAGTCYRAANWIELGDTQGRGKLDTHTLRAQPVRSVWVLPLAKDFRRVLCT